MNAFDQARPLTRVADQQGYIKSTESMGYTWIDED